MTDPRLILHVGAPKCGSSALQTALTRDPDLTDGMGRRFRYVSALYPGNSLLYGAALQRDGIGSRFGYTSFPDIQSPMAKTILQAIGQTLQNGGADEHLPILSNEAWILRHAVFAEALAILGHPPVDVVAFLRPPLEWLNASFWQWGVWSTPNMTAWMDRAGMTYSFAADLEAWSRIPNVHIRVRPSKPDVVRHFAALYDLKLPCGSVSNLSSPPALIGFLLRNRRFRPDGHQSETEFIFQRWCPGLPGRSPWAVSAADLRRFRPLVARTIETLRRILPAEDCNRLFAEPRWLHEEAYHDELKAGMTPLGRLADLPLLLDSLQHGVAEAARIARISPPDTIPMPPPGAGLDTWDGTLAMAMDQLVHCDRLACARMAGRSKLSGFLNRLRTRLA